MFPIDPLWACIAVPAVVVTALVLVRLRLGKTEEGVADEVIEEEKQAEPASREPARYDSTEAEENSTKPEPSGERQKPPECQNYLGYLYMRKPPERTHIPTECYNCTKLLQCLYSPSVVEKVYG